jgi:hypothetical protein
MAADFNNREPQRIRLKLLILRQSHCAGTKFAIARTKARFRTAPLTRARFGLGFGGVHNDGGTARQPQQACREKGGWSVWSTKRDAR